MASADRGRDMNMVEIGKGNAQGLLNICNNRKDLVFFENTVPLEQAQTAWQTPIVLQSLSTVPSSARWLLMLVPKAILNKFHMFANMPHEDFITDGTSHSGRYQSHLNHQWETPAPTVSQSCVTCVTRYLRRPLIGI
jgi:hypothetical protein